VNEGYLEKNKILLSMFVMGKEEGGNGIEEKKRCSEGGKKWGRGNPSGSQSQRSGSSIKVLQTQRHRERKRRHFTEVVHNN